MTATIVAAAAAVGVAAGATDGIGAGDKGCMEHQDKGLALIGALGVSAYGVHKMGAFTRIGLPSNVCFGHHGQDAKLMVFRCVPMMIPRTSCLSNEILVNIAGAEE